MEDLVTRQCPDTTAGGKERGGEGADSPPLVWGNRLFIEVFTERRNEG